MLIYCLIPARKGSQRIKNKNRIIINNKFLINYTINSALNTNQINKKQIIQTEIYLNKGFTLLYKENLKKKN